VNHRGVALRVAPPHRVVVGLGRDVARPLAPDHSGRLTLPH
jgi:hypothetical protein